MAGYTADSPVALPSCEGVPEGYVGNLSSSQSDAVVALKEELQLFVKDREAAVDGNAKATADDPEATEDATDEAKAGPMDPIQPGTPTEEAGEAKELMTSERDMLRFLRARQFDVAKAATMAIDSCKWRASVKPQCITPQMLPNSLPTGCWKFAGYSKSGMPILWINSALWKPSDYYGTDEYIRQVTYFMEGGVARMGPGVDRFLVVFCMGGFNAEMMKPFAMRCVMQLISITQKQYPERLGGAMVCGAPWLFSTFWKIVRPFLDQKTVQKFKFIDKDETNDVLLQFIDRDILSDDYGGIHPPYPLSTLSVCEETDAFYAKLGGRDKLPAGSDLSALVGIADAPSAPESGISGSTKGETSGTKDIAAGEEMVLQVSLAESTKSVAWNFCTVAHDIGFGYKVIAVANHSQNGNLPEGSEPEVLEKAAQAVERVKASEEGGVSGHLDVDKSWAGAILYLMLDNTHSKLRGKTVSYTISVDV